MLYGGHVLMSHKVSVKNPSHSVYPKKLRNCVAAFCNGSLAVLDKLPQHNVACFRPHSWFEMEEGFTCKARMVKYMHARLGNLSKVGSEKEDCNIANHACVWNSAVPAGPDVD